MVPKAFDETVHPAVGAADVDAVAEGEVGGD
jgi:hypothetical protein